MTKEKLHELRRKRAELAAKMTAIVAKEDGLPEGEALPAEEITVFEDLRNSIAALDARIGRVEDALTAESGSTDDAGDNAGGDGGDGGDDADKIGRSSLMVRGAGYRVPATPASRPQTGKGFQVARFMVGIAQAKWLGGLPQAAAYIENRFKDTEVAKALNTTVVSEGGALIPQDFMPDLIELLRANAVVRAASPMDIGMPLGNLTIPRLAGGATAVYQGEMDDISLTEEVFDDLNLSAKKLTAMVPVSNDLLRRSPIGLESIIRDDLTQTIARKEDIVFLRSDGTGKSPVGWRSLVLPANLITVPALGAGSSGLDEVVAALSALMLALQNGMSRMLRPHWFMAPSIARYIATRRDQVGGFYYKDDMKGGTLEGIPFSVSQQIPSNLGAGNGSEIYLVDMADTIIADTMNVMVDMSDVTAYYGTDGDIVSAFQRDQSVFRVIAEHDFNMRHLQSLAIAVVSDWKFTGLAGAPGAPWSSQPLNKTWASAPAAWPAMKTGAAPPPTLYDPGEAETSAFDGVLTDNPGGGPYPTPFGMGPRIDETGTPVPGSDDALNNPPPAPDPGGRSSRTSRGDTPRGGSGSPPTPRE